MLEQQLPANYGPPSGLTWGIKQSFMRYLGAIEDTQIGVGDGASMLDTGAFNFLFEGSTVDPVTKTGSFDFRGTVELTAHGGMLAVKLRNPRVCVTATGGTLSIADTAGEGPGRLVLCTLDDGAYESLDADLFWSAEQVYLTPEGQAVFGGQYAAGQQLDPICWRISV